MDPSKYNKTREGLMDGKKKATTPPPPAPVK